MSKQTLGERFKEKYAINPNNWHKYAAFFQNFGKLAGFTGWPLLGPLLKRLVLFDRPEKNFTQGYVLNLDRGSSDTTSCPWSLVPCPRPEGPQFSRRCSLLKVKSHCPAWITEPTLRGATLARSPLRSVPLVDWRSTR